MVVFYDPTLLHDVTMLIFCHVLIKRPVAAEMTHCGSNGWALQIKLSLLSIVWAQCFSLFHVLSHPLSPLTLAQRCLSGALCDAKGWGHFAAGKHSFFHKYCKCTGAWQIIFLSFAVLVGAAIIGTSRSLCPCRMMLPNLTPSLWGKKKDLPSLLFTKKWLNNV